MDRVRIQVLKRLTNARLPLRAFVDDAGADLFAAVKMSRRGDVLMYDTGLTFDIPPGWCLEVVPRSSVTKKRGLVLANSPGVIDSGYEGTVKVAFRIVSEDFEEYDVGDRIAQVMLRRVPQVEWIEIRDADDLIYGNGRGWGGFGSSGS